MSATRPPAYDDRVSTPIEASRRGAHRARPKPASSLIPVLAGVAVVLLVLGGIYTVLGRSPSDSTSKTNVASTSKASPAASSSGGVKATPSAASTSAGASSSPTPSASSSASTAVNRSIKLVVLNSVPVQGLAKRVQASIEKDGWTVQQTANSTSRNLVTTKIYYGRTSNLATATALATDLGFGDVVKDASIASSGLVVVLGKDAE